MERHLHLSDNGDGRLTAESFVPNFFRANISGPMGARAVSLYLSEAKIKSFYALGMDYAWGHNSVQVFENEMKRANKNFIGKVFAPTGTKDYSTYITKIRQSGADAVYLVLHGDDNNAFLAQARQYGLPDKVALLTEIVDLASIKAVGEASLGLIGSSRYCLQLRQPEEQGVRRVLAQGAQRRAARHLRGRAVAGDAGVRGRHREGQGADADKLRAALETIELDSIKGKVKMRKCDHQAVQQGFMVKVVKKDGYDTPVPEVIATFPGERTTPGLQENDLRRLTRFSDPCGLARPAGKADCMQSEHPAQMAHEHTRLPSQPECQCAVAGGIAVLPRRRADVDLRHHAHRQLSRMAPSTCWAPSSAIRVVRATGTFWLALVLAPIVVGVVGTAFELGILRRLYRRDAHAFLMVTFGLALVVSEAVRLIWGPDALQVPPPKLLSGVVFLMGEPFPVYRLFLAASGIVVAGRHLASCSSGPGSVC